MSQRTPTLLVLIFLGLFLVILVRGGGIREGGDTQGYLGAAACLISGRAPPGKLASYLGYDAVIALCLRSGLGLGAVIALQVLAGALAVLAQYDLGRRLGGCRAGFLAAALVAANPDLVRWHTFLLTDSLYTSSLILTIWALHRVALGPRAGRLALAAALTAATALVRPNGWIMPPIAVVYLSRSLVADRRIRRLLSAGMLLVFLAGAVAVPSFRRAVQAEQPDRMLRRGEVVWGYPAWRIAMPADPAPEGIGWPAAFLYVARHPLACVQLAGFRVLAELAHVRPFYSSRHNVVFLIVLPPLYILAALGFARARHHSLSYLLGVVIAGHLLIVALTFADWDGRFLLYVLPAIAVLAAGGVAALRPDPRGRWNPTSG